MKANHFLGGLFRERVVSVLGVMLFALIPVSAQAGFSILPGLDVEAQIEFDTDSFDDGTDAYSGSFSTTVGGGTTTSTFLGDGSTVTVTGANPLPAVPAILTDDGDGVGLSATISGDDSPAVSEFELGIDFYVKMVNSSADTYDVFAKFEFSNAVDSSGDNAYGESAFTIDTDPDGPGIGVVGTEVFFTDLLSDALNGDEKNGDDLGTKGALVSDSGTVILPITLLPGETLYLLGDLSMEGGAYASDFSAAFSGNLSIGVVPAPGAFLLASIGLSVVGYVRQRRHL